MAAIITDKVKYKFLRDLFTDFDSSGTNYYIGIGRSQVWNSGTEVTPTPLNRDFDERDFRDNLQSVIAVTDKSFVIPRNTWSSGTIYSPYSDYQVGYPTQPYYAVTDENAVYVCIQQGRNVNGDAVGSTVQPTGVDQFNTLELDDGYIWKFLYTLRAVQATNFVTAAYLPVKYVDSAGGAGDLAGDTEQYNVQNAAIDGQILGFRIDNPGSGYGAAAQPAITVHGDNTVGYRARAYGIVDASGSLVNVKFADSNDGIAVRPALGRGYTYASATVAPPAGGGTNATVIPIMGPPGGLGSDPRIDLKSSAVMFFAKPTGREGGDFVVGNDFRQFGLLRNITETESDGGASPLFTATTGRVLRRLNVSVNTVGTITADDSISGVTSGAGGYLDSSYSDSDLFYHQDFRTGFKAFQAGEVVNVGTAKFNVLSDSDGEINKYSGDVLFISNRDATDRSEDGSNDLKCVFQL